MIYLDNAATTRVDDRVLSEVIEYLQNQYGNPGAIYSVGRQAKNAVEKARCRVAEFVGAKPNQIVFTSGGTEANNMVFNGIADYMKQNNKDEVIISSIEHESVMKSAEKMCIKHGFHLVKISTNSDGRVDFSDLSKKISRKTGIVTVMYVNNETGVINPIDEISKLCHEYDALFFTDCVQAAGNYEINVEKIGCDFLSLSSHKIHGLKGTGALFAKNRNILTPLILGGDEQEFGLRGGTENVAGIIAFGKACSLSNENVKQTQKVMERLQKCFLHKLEEMLKDTIKVNGNPPSDGKILNLSLEGADAETLVMILDNHGVCVSAGSACRSHEQEPSYVLLSMGVSVEDARNSIRISFDNSISEQEIIKAAEIIGSSVVKLRKRVYNP